ncbi:hypothetical protein CHS0354_022795 [Potamilus streckersoni]|uniref:Uncharacterized protein n=1 Tax=Potamilus streckersoni TaxID=2493646 RepID=A0AAE0S282_9BIVA|nr:hypothetical protein CHS0354_022795 [Potamilus streckersoni]
MIFNCCKYIRHLPLRLLCIVILLLQDAIINVYLISYYGVYCLGWLASDIGIIILFTATFVKSYLYLKKEGTKKLVDYPSHASHLPLSVISWALYAVVLSSKYAVLLKYIAIELNELDFFGPNTLKTTTSLAGVVFLLLLSSQHDAKSGSDRRRYIDELTWTVAFDILDGVDSTEILFIKEGRDLFFPGMDYIIITFCCVNFLIPTIPLISLSRTKFGEEKVPHRLVLIHKLFLAYLVNLPLLITRMIIWHGSSRVVSIFSLKNIIIISMISYDVYEHFQDKEETSVNSLDGVDVGCVTDGMSRNKY